MRWCSYLGPGSNSQRPTPVRSHRHVSARYRALRIVWHLSPLEKVRPRRHLADRVTGTTKAGTRYTLPQEAFSSTRTVSQSATGKPDWAERTSASVGPPVWLNSWFDR